MTIDQSNYNTKCRANSANQKMEEESEGLRTVESLRGRLLAERQVSRSVKEEAELITKKMVELERHLKEEIRLREKAEKRLKCLMKKLEFFKGSRSSEGSEQLSQSEVSCISSVSTSPSKEEEEESHENGVVVEEKTNHATENVASMEDDQSNSKLKDDFSAERSFTASTTSHEEEESQTGNDSFRYSDTAAIDHQNHLSQ